MLYVVDAALKFGGETTGNKIVLSTSCRSAHAGTQGEDTLQRTLLVSCFSKRQKSVSFLTSQFGCA